MIKYAASYYLTTFVNSEFWITSSKLWRKQRKARISKFQIQIKVLIRLKKKSPCRQQFLREKKEVDQCIMIVQEILWKQSDHQEVFSCQKIVLTKKGKKCLSLSVQCSFLGNVWMAFKHRNRRRPCYNSYTKVTLIFHAILVPSSR